MKPKCVTILMKALDEYFLMVVFMLLLNRVHVFTICMLNLDREIVIGLNYAVPTTSIKNGKTICRNNTTVRFSRTS